MSKGEPYAYYHHYLVYEVIESTDGRIRMAYICHESQLGEWNTPNYEKRHYVLVYKSFRIA